MADIKEDGSEIFHYDIPDFPLSIKKNFIPAHTCFTDISIHWHEEIEITYIASGSIRHQLNGKNVRIKAGEAIFINAKQLHLIQSDDQDCVLYCLIFHPTLLSSANYIAKKYVQPIINNENLDYFFLKESDTTQKQVLDAMVNIEQLQKDPAFELKAVQELYKLWLALYEVLPKSRMNETVINEDLHRIQRMLACIHQNYGRELSLEDICKAGNIGKTKGTQLFSQYLNMTPVEYLINYRLEIASRMLVETSDSVIDIALSTGFSDSSYFARIFRKRMGISPLEYRKEYRGQI